MPNDHAPDGLVLGEEGKARCKTYSAQMKARLDNANMETPHPVLQRDGTPAPVKDYPIKPMYLADMHERLTCIEHIWHGVKGAPVGMPKQRRTLELNGTHFDSVTGGMMYAETLATFYKAHETHKRQYELYTYDLVVLFAISARGAINYWQVEGELYSRIKGGVITTVDRNELYSALERIKRANLWICGELPRPRKDGQPYFQPKEVSLAGKY
jgi:hypothetical protein